MGWMPLYLVGWLLLIERALPRPWTSAQDTSPALTLDEIVARWARAGEALNTVDLEFTRTTRDPHLVSAARAEGRLVLKRPDLAYVELREAGQDKGRPIIHRIAWDATECRILFNETKTALILARPQEGQPAPATFTGLWWLPTPERRGRSPHLPSLPFLFNMTAQDLQERYETSLLPAQTRGFVLRLTPRRASRDFDHALVLLDRHTFRPIAFKATRGKSETTLVAREARFNEPIDDGLFGPAVPEGWSVQGKQEATHGEWWQLVMRALLWIA